MILAGAAWGALVALALGVLRWFNADVPPQRWAELPGTLALMLVWLAPFALAMIAAHQPQADTRVSLLLAAALGGLAVGVLGPVSIAGLLLLPAVLALAVATARTLRTARLPLMGVLGRLAFGLVLAGLVGRRLCAPDRPSRCSLLGPGPYAYRTDRVARDNACTRGTACGWEAA